MSAAISSRDLDKLQAVGAVAGLSTNQSLATRGTLLMDAVADARAAKGTSLEKKLHDSAVSFAEDIRTACKQIGYA